MKKSIFSRGSSRHKSETENSTPVTPQGQHLEFVSSNIFVQSPALDFPDTSSRLRSGHTFRAGPEPVEHIPDTPESHIGGASAVALPTGHAAHIASLTPQPSFVDPESSFHSPGTGFEYSASAGTYTSSPASWQQPDTQVSTVHKLPSTTGHRPPPPPPDTTATFRKPPPPPPVDNSASHTVVEPESESGQADTSDHGEEEQQLEIPENSDRSEEAEESIPSPPHSPIRYPSPAPQPTPPPGSPTAMSAATVEVDKFFEVLTGKQNAIKQFSGEDPNYPLHTFLRVCEGHMKSLTKDELKISFIKNNFSLNSRAAQLANTSALSNTDGITYEDFKKRLQALFSCGTLSGPLAWVFRLRGKLTHEGQSKDKVTAQSPAFEAASDAVTCMTDSPWFESGVMTIDKFRCLVEFLTFALYLNDEDVTGAMKLKFGPADKLWEFSQKIEAKFRTSPAPSTPVAKVGTSQSNLKGAQNTKYKRRRLRPPFCIHCDVSGHHTDDCKGPAGAAASPAPRQSPKKHQMQKRPQGQGNTSPQTASKKFCVIHDSKTHDTLECSVVKAGLGLAEERKRNKQQGRASHQSGEGGGAQQHNTG